MKAARKHVTVTAHKAAKKLASKAKVAEKKLVKAMSQCLCTPLLYKRCDVPEQNDYSGKCLAGADQGPSPFVQVATPCRLSRRL